MKFFEKLSFKWKLTSMTLSLLLMMALGAFFNLQQMKTAFEKTFLNNMEYNAKMLGEKIKAQFFERYGDVQAFALNQSVKSMNSNSMQGDLDQYVSLYVIYDLVLVVDTKGNYISSNTKDAAGVAVDQSKLKSTNYADAPWFKAVMAGQFTEDKKSGFVGTYFESTHYDPLFKLAFNDEAKLSTSFSAPIKNDKGEVIGVITNRANTKWYETEFVTMFDGMAAVGDVKAEMFLVNKEGTILFKHVPFENEGKNVVFHDPKITLKENYFAENDQLVKAMTASKGGASRIVDPVHDIHDLQGFYSLNGDKWVSDIDWHIVVAEEEATALAKVNQVTFMFYLVQSVCILLAVAVSMLFAIAISKKIALLVGTLKENAFEVDKESNSVAASALQLSESSTEQAAALQETVAAVDEISAMVEKNSEGAEKSREMSTQSKDTAERGRHIVENMVNSIRDIEASNNEISDQMNKNSSELSEIVKLIGDIETKTKVINEIVFQTKLLSFNASVEAARAGEYGKGFAVVAEEVGNLAQMSGRAANEISTLLNESVNKVETIVNDSKLKVTQLMSESQAKVQAGTQIAEECGQALDEILNSVSSLDIVISEIATASKEQSTGIREISKAVGQMEQVTQETSTSAQTSSVTAEHLKSKSGELQEVISSLNLFISGATDVDSINIPATHEPSKQNVVSLKNKPKKSKAIAEVKNETPQNSHSVDTHKKAAGSEFSPSSKHPGFKD